MEREFVHQSWSRGGSIGALEGALEGIWEKIRIWGLGCVWWGILIVKLKKRVARKLRRVTLLHFGLVLFDSTSGKFKKSSFA